MSGYNYNLNVFGGWPTFSQIFDGILRDFACRYAKPQIIHEFASAERSGNTTKTAWISDA